MEIGIVGLPKSGKTTVFNAITRGRAQVTAYAGSQDKPNVGVAKVADHRLESLAGIFNCQRAVPAEVIYVDIPGAPEGQGQTGGISGQFLNHLQRTDALVVVARAFDDPSSQPVENGVDPFRDVEAMLYELAFADLEILDRRLGRLADQSKGAKAAEREALSREQALMERLKEGLEGSTAIRDQGLGQDDVRLLEGFRLLTAKPCIIVANVGEDQLSDAEKLKDRLSRDWAGTKVGAIALCGKLEMELAQMEPADEREFRETMDLGESGLNRVLTLSHEVLDLITFFTGNSKEVRAWPIAIGATAVEAAGKVHSDFERGFIRAEVVAFEELERCGSMAEARRQGVLRQEGRSYPVADGDVINILFNV